MTQGSPWLGVLTIASVFCGGLLLLLLLILKTDGLRKAFSQRLRLPLLIALATAGVVIAGLILRSGAGDGVLLAVAVGVSLLYVSGTVSRRWAGWLLAIDGAALLAILSWSEVTRRHGFSGPWWSDLIPIGIIAAFVFVTGRALYVLIRPRAASSTDTTASSETGTPA
ncbi:MAG: hypothetical protein JWR84_2865 [Caulobacter sp.]|nr:hypothetical protein [Caulobacter sp.]